MMTKPIPRKNLQFYRKQVGLVEPLTELGEGDLLGSLVCEGVVPKCLGTKLVAFKKDKNGQKEKKIERREEREKHILLPIFNQRVDLASSMVRSS